MSIQRKRGVARSSREEGSDIAGALQQPSAWPNGEAPLETVQTHISVLLLGRRHVLKLKKAVDFGFLNYTSLARHRRACEAEVTLNRRLCPDTYLGVRSVVQTSSGLQVDFDGTATGRVVDVGVLMRRLPAEGMLDRLVAEDAVSEALVERIARRLADFHREAHRGPAIDRAGSAAAIRANWTENFAQVEPYVGRTLARDTLDTVRTAVERWIDEHRALLRRRVREGRICEGHGDVRCESVCVTGDALDDIRIFDCIEFNARFRRGDVASEVAFLAMDLDARGRGDLGHFLAERYAHNGNDAGLYALLPFYRCYRAFVRGKVTSFCLDEPEFGAQEKAAAAARARGYFELARRYATPLHKPALIAVGGLSGTGKTALARALAGELGLTVVSSDRVRRDLFGRSETPAGYAQGRYRPEADRQTYALLLERAGARLAAGSGVIVDATFRRDDDRTRAAALAHRSGVPFHWIECRLAPEAIRRRLEQRARHGYGQSEATWETAQRQQAEQVVDPIDTQAFDGSLALDTDGPLADRAHQAADWLRTR